MARTRLGLLGSWGAYLGFTAKTAFVITVSVTSVDAVALGSTTVEAVGRGATSVEAVAILRTSVDAVKG